MEWESPEDGVLTEIYVEEGGKVEVGQKIAFIGDKGEAPPRRAEEETAPQKEQARKRSPRQSSPRIRNNPLPPKSKRPKRRHHNPSNRSRLASTRRRDRRQQRSRPSPPSSDGSAGESIAARPPHCRGAGARHFADQRQRTEGRVTEADVRTAMKSQSAQPAAAASQKKSAGTTKPLEGARIHLTGMRKVIAQRLVESKGPVPHFYLNIEVDAGPLMSARAELKAGGEGSDTAKITVNDFHPQSLRGRRGKGAEGERLLR
jgi:pyruvate dehydrogenase E2 component (dihydrolipoamide acetyltransferase)